SLHYLVRCARTSGLKARTLHLEWRDLSKLTKSFPAIVRLKNDTYILLLRLSSDPNQPRLTLQDPGAPDTNPLVIDRFRFEQAWSGDVILVKRNYDITDEDQPFSFRLVAALIFRERWFVRDIGLCALAMSFLALTPIIFWRLLTDRVIYFKAFNTFY